jgi:hypothetical protein
VLPLFDSSFPNESFLSIQQQSTTAADVTTIATTGGWTKASGIMTMMPLPLPSSPIGTVIHLRGYLHCPFLIFNRPQ